MLLNILNFFKKKDTDRKYRRQNELKLVDMKKDGKECHNVEPGITTNTNDQCL
jgi:hypothetical protein